MRRSACRHGAVLILFFTLSLAQACAPTMDHATAFQGLSPRLLAASPESRVGGEARFEGELHIRENCIVVGSGRTLPIFDPSVRLTETGDAILDSRTGVRIAVGEHFSAAAAFFRDEGRGWSLSDIERATGVDVSEGCDTDAIVRLRNIQRGPSR
jgi:hypothetical protein